MWLVYLYFLLPFHLFVLMKWRRNKKNHCTWAHWVTWFECRIAISPHSVCLSACALSIIQLIAFDEHVYSPDLALRQLQADYLTTRWMWNPSVSVFFFSFVLFTRIHGERRINWIVIGYKCYTSIADCIHEYQITTERWKNKTFLRSLNWCINFCFFFSFFLENIIMHHVRL